MEIKVIFHIDEVRKWELLLKNIMNLMQAVNIESKNGNQSEQLKATLLIIV